MTPICPFFTKEFGLSEVRFHVVRAGFFKRKCDSRKVRRFRCRRCRRYFSNSTFSRFFGQKKRHLNMRLWVLLCSGVSQRRSAKLLGLSRTTVATKLCGLGPWAEEILVGHNLTKSKESTFQFDDLETFEHTKCKPLS